MFVTDLESLDFDNDSLDGFHDVDVLSYLKTCEEDNRCPYVIMETLGFDSDPISGFHDIDVLQFLQRCDVDNSSPYVIVQEKDKV